MNKTHMSLTHLKSINKATFIGKAEMEKSREDGGGGGAAVPIESPRNQRYQAENQYAAYDRATSRRIEEILAI